MVILLEEEMVTLPVFIEHGPDCADCHSSIDMHGVYAAPVQARSMTVLTTAICVLTGA